MLKNKFFCSVDEDDLKKSYRQIFQEEELNGIGLLNKVHYLLAFLFAIPLMLNVILFIEEHKTGALFNLGLIIFLFLLSIVHTVVIRFGSLVLKRIFSYIVIACDYLSVSVIMVYWNVYSSPGNFAFTVKQPMLMVFVIFIIITIFQFRIRLVLFSCFFSVLIYYFFVLFALSQGAGSTSDWNDYILGTDLVLTDVTTSKPLLFMAVTLCTAYVIKRTRYMLLKMVKIESQKQSLSRYFSPEVAAEIIEDPETIQKGKRQRAVILFSDIRGFTKLSENMPPEELSNFLTAFRHLMSEAVIANGGIIDKYMGDGVMVLFGVPRSAGNEAADCQNAVNTGFAMLEKLAHFNKKQTAQGKPAINIGIGLHMGEVFAGVIGVENQLEYTVIGDAVNTASRIESLCKEVSARFLVSKEVYNKLEKPLAAELLPPAPVKGKKKPLDIYKLG